MGSTMALICFIVGLSMLTSGIAAQEDISEIIHTDSDCSYQIDLVILIDGSNSVKSSNFLIVKEWIKELANGFKINSGNVLLGVVQYSYWYRRRPMWRQKYIKTEIPLGKYTNYRDFSSAVDRIEYQGYQTFTAHAINKTVDYDFQSRHSRYPEAQRAIILLTDGHATDAKDLPAAIDHAKNDAGVVIFAVGVGDYSIEELRIITRNDNRRIFELQNFNELTNIVYELPLVLRKACDCNLVGSVDNECDVCTRQCKCKPNVVGRRCDSCALGYYRLTGTGCIACQCNSLGVSDDTKCDKNTGNCVCKSGVVGVQCDKCETGRFNFPECNRCDCNGFSTTCSPDGNCIGCFDNRSGKNCETCKSGFYMSTSSRCIPCECNGNINVDDPDSCDAKTGECLKCLNGTAGTRCEQCAEYHYRNAVDASCTKCSCNLEGTAVESCSGDNCNCDQDSGQCTCSANVVGKTCDSCASGFWNLRKEVGCEACGCHGLGSMSNICDTITGKCECRPGHTGIKCETCDYGHSRLNDEDSCGACDCNLSGTLESSCINGSCSCDATSGQCSCLPNVVGESCTECESSYWGFGSEEGCKNCDCSPIGSLSPVCDTNTGVCLCHSGTKRPKCDICKDGFYGMNEQEKCKECGCNLSGTMESTCDDEACSCNATSGQCSCLPNVTGISCSECAKNYWGFGSEDGCKSCECNPIGSLSRSCDKDSGVCECLPGQTGSKCDICDVGYYKMSEKELCKECVCNRNGTSDDSCEGETCNCNQSTGQCVCRANVIGVSCDSCAYDFWNFGKESGCEACGCHGEGSAISICDELSGQCECLPGHTGTKCEKCDYGYSKSSKEDVCKSCDCNLSGTLESSCRNGTCSCDATTGQCSCLSNVVGESCSECESTYWGFASEEGCRKCDCSPIGSVSQVCDTNTGVCVCYSGTKGLKCDICEDGFYGMTEQEKCKECSCNLSGTVKSTCGDETCSCNATSGQCSCLPNVIGIACYRCAQNYWGFGSEDGCKSCQCNPIGSLSQSCNKNTGVCECLPGHVGTKCDRCDVGYYRINDQELCKECICNRNGTSNDNCEGETCKCDQSSGQCICRANVIGLSCDSCADGFWNLGEESGCKACGCHGKGSASSICDKVNGECVCLPGHSGTKCEKCDYGHSKSSKEDACTFCDCNLSGTIQSSCMNGTCTCDTSGQCSCLPNVVGTSCSQCAENYWDFGLEDGCRECNCDATGSISTSCDSATGVCECLPDYTGNNCDTCDKSYYKNNETGLCKACECVRFGTDESTCDDDSCTCETTTGQCSCLPNVVGVTCNECADNHWGFASEDICTPCKCNELGSTSTSCNVNTGFCECLIGYTGMMCDSCDSGYFQNDGKCQKCECHRMGTNPSSCSGEGCECDQFTAQCSCITNVVGKSCDQCSDGFWNFDHYCEECECHPIGSVSTTCNKDSGECECKVGYAGRHCDKCAWGYTESGENKACELCKCSVEGIDPIQCTNGICGCHEATGECSCKENVIGKFCSECKDLYWGFNTTEGCTSCECNPQRSLSEECNKHTGKCDCLPKYGGEKCEKCAHGHFGDSCEKCDCNLFGTEFSECADIDSCSCDPVSGQCSCYPNVVGKTCNECANGFWNLESSDGCESCGCHARGSVTNVCNKKTGQCECLPGYTGDKCENCKHGHSKEDDDSCTACDCNLSGTNTSTCDVGSCSCDSTTGQCTCLPNVIGLSCDACKDGYWDFGFENGCKLCECHKMGSFSQTCNKKSGKCECLPGHVGNKCDLCGAGYSRKYPKSKCKACRCDPLGTVGSSLVAGVYACEPLSGQCTCLPNVVGLSCDKCRDGFYNLASKKGCKPCDCSEEGRRSAVCDKITGSCDCLSGHGGDRCEKCKMGYYRTSPVEQCTECKCNMYGRNPKSCAGTKCACDPMNGRCNCLPHVTGMTCDRCEDGFWNLRSMRGCQPCYCHERGSSSRICEKKSGQCECHVGNIGQGCEKCDEEYAKLNSWDKCKSSTINDEGTNKTYTTKTTKSKDVKKPTPTSNIAIITGPYTTRRPYIPSTRYTSCSSCGKKWPSYCHGWMCRRRWPYQQFKPSPRRCNYGHKSCQYNVATMYGKTNRKPTVKIQLTTPTKQRPARPSYGYRLYGNTNYYMSYNQRQRQRTYTRSRSNSHRSRSYGLYGSLYGRWN